MNEVQAAIEARLAAEPVRRGLRKRRPPVSLVVLVRPLPGDEAVLVDAVRERSKSTDVVGVLGDAAVAIVLDGADAAGAQAYLERVWPTLPLPVLGGVATATETDDAESLLRRAWPAG